MSKVNNLSDFLIDIANTFRDLEQSNDLINPQSFSNRIRAISGKYNIDLTSNSILFPSEMSDLVYKKKLLENAMFSISIDGEKVYRIESFENETSTIDIAFYTGSGDRNGYYYILSGIDNKLYKENIGISISINNPETNKSAYAMLNSIYCNGEKCVTIEQIDNTFKINNKYILDSNGGVTNV